MAFEGELEDFHVSEIIQLIYQQQKSGTLKFFDEDREITIIFEKGQIVRAYYGKRENFRWLNDFLLNSARVLDRAKLMELRHLNQENSPFDTYLLNSNIITEQELRELKRDIIQGVILSLLNWKKGRYSFEPSKVEESSSIKFSTEQLLLDSLRLKDEWENSFEAKAFQKAKFSILKPIEEQSNLTLTELRVYHLVKEKKDFDLIKNVADLDPINLTRTIKKLVELGYIQPITIEVIKKIEDEDAIHRRVEIATTPDLPVKLIDQIFEKFQETFATSSMTIEERKMKLQEALAEILPDNVIQDATAIKKLEDALLLRGAPRDGIYILQQAIPKERKKPKVILQFLEVDTQEQIELEKEKLQQKVTSYLDQNRDFDAIQVIDALSIAMMSFRAKNRQAAISMLHGIADLLLDRNKADLFEYTIKQVAKSLRSEQTFDDFKHKMEMLVDLMVKTFVNEMPETGFAIEDVLVSQLDGSVKRTIEEKKLTIKLLKNIRTPKIIKTLVNVMENPQLYEDALEAVLEYGKEAINPLIDLLNTSTQKEVRMKIIEILSHLGPDSALFLRDQIHSSNWQIRRNTCLILGLVKDTYSANAIKKLTTDPYAQVRITALESLVRIIGQEAEDALIEAIKDPDVEVRRTAIRLLGKIQSKKAIPQLVALLPRTMFGIKDVDDKTKMEACMALAEMKAKEAVPALISLLSEKFILSESKYSLQQYAAIALGKIGDPSARKALEKAAKSINAKVSSAAKNALKELDGVSAKRTDEAQNS